MPSQRRGCYQWVREKNAVFAGYGDICFDAIHTALYAYGLSDFDAFSMCIEAMQYTAVLYRLNTAVFIPLEETEQTSFSEIEG